MKTNLILCTAFAASILSGCVTTGSDSNVDLTNINFNELTCEQISQTFKDYKANVDSGDALTGLLSIASTDASAAANKAKSAAMNVYHQAKKTAAPAIKAKGCRI
ncbi:hypothetical protein [Psychrobium sp. 1_MG-2023]|uniref:hypothetical protein n=1 Tax=Psychrobium sp. 1_MG-2023 TaxID=3062624 RepID=UPI000C332DD3|nr:hypothetical protein [Psychrobium sp. 1_MG-2023]MDP2559627.1 hypothetical protein [Psychrobium sp. 1_MG-2023]PKF59460.1 hypothetical protein CW748_01430 [Alteromonadales bacterium alter-6D02]